MKKVFVLLLIAMILMAFSAGCISNRSSSASKQNVEKVTVSVPTADIKRVEVSPGTATAKVGYTMQFSARAFDSGNNYISGTAVSWRLEEKGGRASISSTGLLTPDSTGNVNVVATINGVSGTSLVEIESAPRDKCYYDRHCDRSLYIVRDDDDYRYNRYQSNRYDDDDYRSSRYNDDHSNLPAGHCYYKDETLERLTQQRVPC